MVNPLSQVTTVTLVVILFFIRFSCTTGCSNSLPSLYSLVGADVSFTFQYTVPPSGIVTVKVTNQAGTEIVSVTYFGGNVAGQALVRPRVDFTGVFNTGNCSFTLNNIQTSDSGMYTLSSQDVTQYCVTLYVTGKPTKPVISPTSVSVNIGDTATFTCTSSSTTVPTGSGLTMFYILGRNGVDVMSGRRYTVSGQTLSVTNVVKGDSSDTFTCTARENKGLTSDESDSARIDVTYGPDAVTVQPTTTDYSYEKGVSINTITCSADCNPPCTFQWSRQPSASLSSGRVLSLGSADKSDVGTYTCTASRVTSSSRDSASVTVTVNYGPGASIVMTPSAAVHTFNENQDSLPNIQCSADCNPGCTYSWSGDRTGPVTPVNGFLSLGVANRIKADRYTCTATRTGNQASTATISVTVFVRYGPTDIQLNPPTGEVTVIEGSTTQDINCSSDCYPGCDCTWNQFNNYGVFHLGTVYRNVSGIYTCTCINKYTQTGWRLDKRVTVTVQYFPDLHITTTKVVTEHDTNIQLSCTADGVPAQYTFGGWTHFLPDNQTAQHDLSNTAIVGNVVSLTLPTVTYMDTGIYRCIVSNGITDYRTGEVTAMAETTILVKGSPVITEQEARAVGQINEKNSLSAKVFSQSEIVVQWYKDHNGSWSLVSDGRFNSDVTVAEVAPLYYGVPVKQSGFMASLHIENVQPSDFAEYRLVVRNNIGNTSNTTTFRISGPPEPPKDFQVVYGSETTQSVSFTWVSGFYGGADQTFVIEFSPSASKWNIGAVVPGGKEENKPFHGTIEGLDSHTTYTFRLSAISEFGKTSFLETSAQTTKEPEEHSDTEAGSKTGPIIGGILAGTAVAVLAVGIVVYMKRRNNADSIETCPPNSVELQGNNTYQDLSGARPPPDTYDTLPTDFNNKEARVDETVYVNTQLKEDST